MYLGNRCSILLSYGTKTKLAESFSEVAKANIFPSNKYRRKERIRPTTPSRIFWSVSLREVF